MENVDVIYSTDPDIATHAKSVGIECRGISDLPLAPSVQEALPFEGRAGDNEGGEEAVGPPKGIVGGDD